MNEMKTIIQKLYFESLHDKKHTLFLVIIIGVISGFIIPMLFKSLSERIQISTVAIFSVILLRQWSAESFTSEKENNTLESLLSTCVDLKKLFWSEVFYNFLLATIVEYVLIIIFSLLNYLISIQNTLSVYEILLLIILLMNLKIFIAIVVTFISLTSKDVRIANSKASKYLYMAIIAISIVITLKINAIPNLIIIYICFAFIIFLTNLATIKRINTKLSKICFEDVLY